MEDLKPKIFVGSSTEGLDVADTLQSILSEKKEMDVILWKDDVFSVGMNTTEVLTNSLSVYDFGIFIFTPDDKITVRKRKYFFARDNVLFEFGLFVGRLGFKNTFIVHPDIVKLKFPSDIFGIITAPYDHEKPNLSSALRPACRQIRKRVKEIYEGQYSKPDLSWNDFWTNVRALSVKLRYSTVSQGGFVPQIIIGITYGGMIVGDLLARDWSKTVPIVSLVNQLGQSDFDTPINESLVSTIKQEGIRNILLVNDISRSGITIENAFNYLKDKLDDKIVMRTAVLVEYRDDKNGRKTTKFKIDYQQQYTDLEYYKMPYALPWQETVFITPQKTKQ